MNIIVCIKQTLDTAAKIEIVDGEVFNEGVPRIINPYDEFAIEEALRIKEKKEGTQVTLLTVGPEKFQDSLRTGLAMGADEAIHVLDPELGGIDGRGVAQVLASVIQDKPFDLILCGRQAVDDDMGRIGPALAVLLGIPFITVITKLELCDGEKKVIVTRQIEGGLEIMETAPPALLTCQKGLNEPRLPSLKGIMKAKKKEILILDAKMLGLDVGSLVNDSIKLVDLTLPEERKKGIILEGGVQECTAQLASILRNDAKVV